MIFKTFDSKIDKEELRLNMQNAISQNDAKEYIKLSKIYYEYFGIINDVRDMR